jgi:hypothetical protein
VRKLLMLATCALVSSLFLAPAVGAQEMMEEKMDDSMMMEEKMEEPKMEKGKMMEMPKTGGVVAPSTLILPAAAALLLGSGLLAYGIQRRRS